MDTRTGFFLTGNKFNYTAESSRNIIFEKDREIELSKIFAEKLADDIYSTVLLCIIILLSASCTRKPVLWQGSYANFVTPENPKEDFKVGEYLVVAYAPAEELKYSRVFYKFAIIRDSVQIGLVSYEKMVGSGYLLAYEYFDRYNVPVDDTRRFFETEKKSLVTLELYRLPLFYNELKYFIINKLLGLEGLTYIDYTDEGDTVTISFNPDGKWYASISRDVSISFAMPRILTINSDITIYLKDDENWEFADSVTLIRKNTSDVITVVPEPAIKHIFAYGEIEIKPRLISAPPPYYPEEMRKKGIEGDVIIGMIVETDGSVLSCRIIRSSGYGAFDFAALRAGLKYKFTPAIQHNKPVRVKIAQKIQFKLRR